MKSYRKGERERERAHILKYTEIVIAHTMKKSTMRIFVNCDLPRCADVRERESTIYIFSFLVFCFLASELGGDEYRGADGASGVAGDEGFHREPSRHGGRCHAAVVLSFRG